MRPLIIVAKLARFELSATARLEMGIAVLTTPNGFGRARSRDKVFKF